MPFEEDRPLFTYCNLFRGHFTIRAEANDDNEKIQTRVNKDGKTVREYHYKKLSKVKLADIREAEHEEYGPSWEFIFLDGNEYVLLKISKNSPVSNMILNRLENLDLKSEVTLVAGYIEEEEKNLIGVNQHGEWVQRVYTKEKPGA